MFHLCSLYYFTFHHFKFIYFTLYYFLFANACAALQGCFQCVRIVHVAWGNDAVDANNMCGSVCWWACIRVCAFLWSINISVFLVVFVLFFFFFVVCSFVFCFLFFVVFFTFLFLFFLCCASLRASELASEFCFSSSLNSFIYYYYFPPSLSCRLTHVFAEISQRIFSRNVYTIQVPPICLCAPLASVG